MSLLQASATHFAACTHIPKLLSLAVMREIHFLGVRWYIKRRLEWTGGNPNFKISFSDSSADREYDCDYESQHCAHSTAIDARFYCFRGEARPECVICHQFIGLLPKQTET